MATIKTNLERECCYDQAKFSNICPECHRQEDDYRRVYQTEAGDFLGHNPIMVCSNRSCGRFINLSEQFQKVGDNWKPTPLNIKIYRDNTKMSPQANNNGNAKSKHFGGRKIKTERMNKKYSLTNNKKIYLGRTLFQIKAEVPFGNVDKGELGGWIEKEKNLSQEGNSWISGNAMVFGNAKISGDAMVFGNALVFARAKISGNAKISGDAMVFGDAMVCDNAIVSGSARVSGNTMVSGNLHLSAGLFLEEN